METTLRLRAGLCSGPAVASRLRRAPNKLPGLARSKLADKPSAECPDQDGCVVGHDGLAHAIPAPLDSGDVRLALERLYGESPLDWSLDWSRPFFLVTTDGGEPPARRAALASGPPPQQQQTPPDQRERSPDYYANVGDAIRTLREDIPQLFDRELNFSIYRDDITFRDPRNSFSGIQNYKTIFWSLRFHGRIFFTKLHVDVKRIWQTEDGCIRMRWTVRGVPRVPWEAEGTFDGISQYKLDKDGKIYEHAVDNVILRDPPVGVLPWLYSINLSPARQQAVPGAFFRPHGGGGAAAAAQAAAAGEEAAGAEGGRQRRRRLSGAGEQQPERWPRWPQQQHAACGGCGDDVGARAEGAAALLQQRQGQWQQEQQQQGLQPGWWSSLLARFSWVRMYAAIVATMQLLQQQQEQLRLQPAPVQQVCTERS